MKCGRLQESWDFQKVLIFISCVCTVCDEREQFIKVVAGSAHEYSSAKLQVIDDAHCGRFEAVGWWCGSGTLPKVVEHVIKTFVEIGVVCGEDDAAVQETTLYVGLIDFSPDVIVPCLDIPGDEVCFDDGAVCFLYNVFLELH